MPTKKRVLEELKIDEISGVDNPCQEGARVTIMKRREDKMDTEELEGAVTDLSARVEHLHKAVEAAQVRLDKKPSTLSASDFEVKASEIRKRDACSHTEAFAKARKEHPNLYAVYQRA
jgi:hypothetical protein